MLQFIRERAQGVVAVIIILFLCLTFLLWGIDEYMRAARQVIVAEVNGEDIDLGAYQANFQRLRQRAQAELGDQFDSSIWAEESTKKRALDFLVEERLLTQAIDDSRLRISDPQIAGFIRGAETFTVDGKFSLERYKQAVNMLGFTEAGFEAQARNDLAVQQLRAGVALSAFATEPEAERLAQLFAQKRDIGYVLIEPGEPDSVTVSDADAEAYYKANHDLFRIDEKVTLEYLELSLEKLKKEISVDDQLLTAHYDASTDAYTTQEQRSANHILVQLKAGASAEEDAAAKAKIETLRALVEGGMSFEEVAKQNSDDIGSRAEGGDTGLFPRGVMAPEFEEAVFAMQPGEMSQPVKTEFGYHLIRVREIKPGGTKSFEDVRHEVEDAYRLEQAENLYFDRAEAFSNAVTEHPDSLEAAADAMNLEPQSIEPLTRLEVEERFSAEVASAAWEPEVLTEGLASMPIEIGNTRIVAVRVVSHAPSRVPAFTEIKDDAIAALRDERLRQAVRTRGEAVLARLEQGEAVAEVMAAENLEWVEEKGVVRDSGKINRAVARAAFSAPLLVGQEPVVFGVPIGTSSFAVARVGNLQLPTAEELEGKNVDVIKRDASRTYMASSWQGFVALLRDQGKVKTYPERL
jgi:peptidyl-prolyl cis-trans isomerase D